MKFQKVEIGGKWALFESDSFGVFVFFFSLRREQFTGPRVASGGRESWPSITEGVAAESSGTAAGRRGSADAGVVLDGVRSEGWSRMARIGEWERVNLKENGEDITN